MPTRTKKPAKVRKKAKVWQPIYLVHIYRLAKAGLSDEAIARGLEINRNTIKLWKKSRGEVREALELGRQETPEDGFTSYFYTRLPTKLQALWAEVSREENGVAEINTILADHGTRARQSLFLHALVASHFSPTRAMEKVGIDKRQLDTWSQTDPDFAELVEEIGFHKRNFCEEKLMKLVGEGDRTAVLFANRGLNRERYGTSQDINVNHSGAVEHRLVIDLNELELSLTCRAEIAQSLRVLEERKEKSRLLALRPPEERVIEQIAAQISTVED